DIRQGCVDRLMNLSNNHCGVVDAETQTDLDQFAADLLTAASRGKKFLFRSAASLLTALAQLPPQPVAAEKMSKYVRGGQPGAFLVGSHVQKTTSQLTALLQEPGVMGIELDLNRMRDRLDAAAELEEEAVNHLSQAFDQGKTPVVYTSREELTFSDDQTRLEFGLEVSTLLMKILRQLPSELGYLVSKGGITSNDTVSQGLTLPTARLLGQIIPGCSVICTPETHPQFPSLPVVLFPGNVGNEKGLVDVHDRFTRDRVDG
ncbi:MAG: nucleotide-binding domain containing protein, partial [Cyanobacteria bacterium P01_F01_bin.42]